MQKLLELNSLQAYQKKWSNYIRNLNLSNDTKYENELYQNDDSINKEFDSIRNIMKKYISDNYRISTDLKNRLNDTYKILMLDKSQFDTKNNHKNLNEYFYFNQSVENLIQTQFLKNNQALDIKSPTQWIKKVETCLIKFILCSTKYLVEVSEYERLNDFLKNRFSFIVEENNKNMKVSNKLSEQNFNLKQLLEQKDCRLNKVEKENMDFIKTNSLNKKTLSILNAQINQKKNEFLEIKNLYEKERLDHITNKTILVKEVNCLRNKLRESEVDTISVNQKIEKVKKLLK